MFLIQPYSPTSNLTANGLYSQSPFENCLESPAEVFAKQMYLTNVYYRPSSVPGIMLGTDIKWEAKQSPGPHGVSSLSSTSHACRSSGVTDLVLPSWVITDKSSNLPAFQGELPYKTGTITINLIMSRD